jgi:hypothetical protein
MRFFVKLHLIFVITIAIFVIYKSLKITAVATIWGDAEPEPDWPFNVMTGANEVWLRKCKRAAVPVVEKGVGK